MSKNYLIRGKQHLTNGICYAACSAARGYVRLGHSAALHSTHIFAALVLLRKPLFGLQKRRIPRTLDEIGFKNIYIMYKKL